MKCLAIFTLLFVRLHCEANNNLVCKKYDSETKTLENYCGGPLPADCLTTALAIDATVENLKFRYCDSAVVLNTTKFYPNILKLDISCSEYSNIDWFNVPLMHLKMFDASNNSIRNIKNLLQTAPRVIDIDLSFNQLTIIESDSFGTLNDLIDINLSSNWLQHINPNGFAKISANLEHIDLRNNSLVGIPELPNCNKLRILHLEDNAIKNFTCQRISWRDTLSAIYLSWANVEQFDGSSEHCKRFRVILDADKDGILRTSNESVITYELLCNQNSFQNVKRFRAGHNKFQNIYALFDSFGAELHELDVSGNSLAKLYQKVFKKFVQLQKLALSDTQLHSFDLKTIQNPNRLELLDLSNNCLDQIQNLGWLDKFVELKVLNISGNRLRHDAILQVLNHPPLKVEALDFSDNYVGNLYYHTFDDLADKNTALKTLSLRNTSLSLADNRNPFEKLSKLHTLDVSNNNLSDVKFFNLSETLINLHSFEAANCELNDPLSILQYFGHSLQRINLSGNRIGGGGFISPSTFQALTTLVHLNLSATDLRVFDFKSIIKQEWLYILDISKNRLQSIDMHELPHFVHLKRLYLNDNELKKLDRFKPNQSPNVLLTLSQNQLPCLYLKKLRHENPDLKYIDNPLDQKHGEDCRSSTQAIGDFLDSVYDTVKFW